MMGKSGAERGRISSSSVPEPRPGPSRIPDRSGTTPPSAKLPPDGEVVKGFAEFKKAETFWGSPDFKAVRFDIRDLRIKLSRTGDVAWFYGLLDDINEWKGRPASWENTRWTGVLEKRDGRWIMVQQHFSFAAK